MQAGITRLLSCSALMGVCGLAPADVQTQIVAVSRQDAGATGGVFDTFGNARLNELGEVLFWARSTANRATDNDDCAGAIPIGLGATYFTTRGAMDSAPITCASRSDVWFEFTDHSGADLATVQFYLAGAEYGQAAIGIFQDNCGTLLQIGCFTGVTVPSVWFSPTMRTVKLRVGSNSIGQSGEGLLVARQTLPGPSVTVSTSTTDGALWSDAGGVLSPILREATTTFDPMQIHESFNIAAWSMHGAAATSAVQATPVLNTTRAVLLDWSAETAAVMQVAIDTIPAAPPYTPTIPGPASLTDDGAMAFALLDGTSIRYGETVHGAGSAAPGLDGLTWQSFDQPSVSSNGHVGWRSRLAGEGVNDTNDVALWKDVGTGPTIIVRAGQQVPAAKPGVVFTQFGADVGVDAAGGVTFWAVVSGPGVDSSNNSGIWSDRGGELAAVVRAGAPAPEAGLHAAFASFARRPMVNAAGDVAVAAFVAGPNTTPQTNSGLWVFRANDTRRLLAREGAAAPGLEGVQFATFGEGVINDRGDLAFVATLRGEGVAPANAQMLCFAGAEHGVVPIVRSGAEVSVGEGDSRTVREIMFGTGRVQGGHGQFNAQGTLLYQLALTDRTTALVKSTIVCPADFDNSGVVEVSDIFAYLAAWFSMDAAAEWDGEEDITVADLLEYLTQWFGGC